MRHETATILVTGAASGIGHAVLRRLLADGSRVVATDLNRDRLEHVVRELAEEQRERVVAVAHDVTVPEDWDRAVSLGVAQFGLISGLVNNAGITKDATMLKMEQADFDAVFETHVRASWMGCRAVIPGMRDAGGGAIVNVSSSGRHGVFGQTNYSPAKAAIVGLTKSVALEQARYGIRCNAVAPGAIETPMTAGLPERVAEELRNTIVLGRFGRAEEVAAAVSFLLSDDSSFVNAHVLDVNGGEPHL